MKEDSKSQAIIRQKKSEVKQKEKDRKRLQQTKNEKKNEME